MARWVLAVLALLAVFASPAAAGPPVGSQPPFVLVPGERVTIFRRDNGEFAVVRVERLTTRSEAGPVDRDADQEYMQGGGGPTAFGASEDTLRFSLWADRRDGVHLKLENGLSGPIIYSAEIVLRDDPGTAHPTTICSVGAGKVGYELWPDDIIAIRITGFYRAPRTGQVCGYPERGELSAPPPTINE